MDIRCYRPLYKTVSAIVGVIFAIVLSLATSGMAIADEAQLVATSTPIASGTSGTISWSIGDNYRLTLEPSNGISGKFDIYAFDNSTTPWEVYKSDIKSIEVKTGVGFEAGTNASNMFSGCNSLTSADLSGLDTSNVTSLCSMFNRCSNLKSVRMPNLNTGNVSDMSMMFSYCASLTSLDLSHFDTKNVRDFSLMFSGCESLASVNVSSFDTSNVTNFEYMFSGCGKLTSLDISSFSTTKASNLSGMLSGCSLLRTLKTGSGWKQSHIVSRDYVATMPTLMSDGATTFERDSVVPDGSRTFTHVHAWTHWGEQYNYNNYYSGYSYYLDPDSLYGAYTAPTCTAAGKCSRYCIYCGEDQWQALPATGHDVRNVITSIEPTFIQVGQQSGTCYKCWTTQYFPVPAKAMTPEDRAAIDTIAVFYKYAKSYNVKKMSSCFKGKPKKAFFTKGLFYKLLKKQNKKKMSFTVVDGTNNGSSARYELNVQHRSAYKSVYKAMAKSYNGLMKQYKKHRVAPSKKYTNQLVNKYFKKYVKAKSFHDTEDTVTISLVKDKGKWKIASASDSLKDSVNGNYDTAISDAEEDFRDKYE